MPAVTWAGCWVLGVETRRNEGAHSPTLSDKTMIDQQETQQTTDHWHLRTDTSPESDLPSKLGTLLPTIYLPSRPQPQRRHQREALTLVTLSWIVAGCGGLGHYPIHPSNTGNILGRYPHIYFWSCKLIPNNLWGALLRMEKLQNSLYKHTFKMMKVMWKFNRDHFQSPFGAIFQRNNCV